MTALSPDIHDEREASILKRHSNASVGEFVTRLGIGLTAPAEKLLSRLAIPIPPIEEKKFRAEQDASRVGLSEEELSLHDSIAVQSLIKILESAVDYIQKRS